MSEFARIERLLGALPRLQIGTYPAGTKIPKQRKVSALLDYNGFDGFARNRIWEVCKWLMAGGVMPAPAECDICGGEGTQYHAENYFDLTTYVPICKSCHSKVHNRLKNFRTWETRRAEFAKSEDHWINRLEPEQLPVAEWCSANNQTEPTFADFVAPE